MMHTIFHPTVQLGLFMESTGNIHYIYPLIQVLSLMRQLPAWLDSEETGPWAPTGDWPSTPAIQESTKTKSDMKQCSFFEHYSLFVIVLCVCVVAARYSVVLLHLFVVTGTLCPGGKVSDPSMSMHGTGLPSSGGGGLRRHTQLHLGQSEISIELYHMVENKQTNIFFLSVSCLSQCAKIT